MGSCAPAPADSDGREAMTPVVRRAFSADQVHATMRLMGRLKSVTAVIFAAVATITTSAEAASPSDQWPAMLRETSTLLANGEFAGAHDRLSKLTRDMADEITTPSELDRLFAIALAQLAVAEAARGNAADAIWHWQIAQNVHRDVRTFEMTVYGKDAEALIANTLPPAPEKCARPANEPAPDILKRSEPKYPKRARQVPVTGLVIVEIELDPEGRPVRPQVLRSPSAALTYSTLVALRDWRFAAPELEEDRSSRFCRLFSFGRHQ